MTATTVSPPGTVDNLTPEQEAKLRELWLWVAKLCGTTTPEALKLLNNNNSMATPAAAAKPAPPAPTPQQQPSRRFSWFSRSSTTASNNNPPKNNNTKDNDTASVTSTSTQTKRSSLSLSSTTSRTTTNTTTPDITANINDGSGGGEDKYGQMKEFKQTLTEMHPSQIRDAFWTLSKNHSPDAVLLRFLRARKWDVRNALVMLVSTMRWRALELKVDSDIMVNGEALAHRQVAAAGVDAAEKKEAADFLHQMRCGKGFIHGVDRYNRPVAVIRAHLHKPFGQSASSLERFIVYLFETASLMMPPRVESATLIFDLSKFTLANMDYTPIKIIIKAFEANYPECLGAILIHKAPWVFWGVWTIIKGWLDPVVASKVHFTKNVKDLEAFIPRNHILKEHEGDEDWEYSYIEPPAGVDENEKMKDTAARDAVLGRRKELVGEFEGATMDWCLASGGGGGGGNGDKKEEEVQKVQEKRGKIAEDLGRQYWEVDPFVRAVSVYDREGVFEGGGKVNFYPQAKVNGSK